MILEKIKESGININITTKNDDDISSTIHDDGEVMAALAMTVVKAAMLHGLSRIKLYILIDFLWETMERQLKDKEAQ